MARSVQLLFALVVVAVICDAVLSTPIDNSQRNDAQEEEKQEAQRETTRILTEETHIKREGRQFPYNGGYLNYYPDCSYRAPVGSFEATGSTAYATASSSSGGVGFGSK